MNKSTNEPTDTNTHLAPDGRYYDPNRLESYFVTQASGFAALLKEIYTDDCLRDLIFKDNPLVKMVKK